MYGGSPAIFWVYTLVVRVFPLATRKHMLGRTSAICLFKNTPQIFANNLKNAPKPLTIISTKGETNARVYSTICVGNKRDKIKNAYDTTR